MSKSFLEHSADKGFFLMQGRLSAPEEGRFQSFPRVQWQREIELASQVPLRGIEWIYDLYGEGANPLETVEGRLNLKNQLASFGVEVVSICADYFMDCPFVRIDQNILLERINKLKWLISISYEMGISRIVLPFVDASKISNNNDLTQVLNVLYSVLPLAKENAVELHLETDMSPLNFKHFLDEIKDEFIKVNYDSGNSASLGYAPYDEFSAYGERIGSFHIKDRVLNGGTVPLGQGNADFKSLRAGLLDIEYKGDFVLQVARGTSGHEFEYLKDVVSTAKAWLCGHALIEKT